MTSSASVSNNQMRKDKKHRVMRCFFFMNIKGILPGAENYNFAGMRKSCDDTGDEVTQQGFVSFIRTNLLQIGRVQL